MAELFNFRNAVDTTQRYILNDDSKEFLNSILDTCGDRERFFKAENSVWRAQNGRSW